MPNYYILTNTCCSHKYYYLHLFFYDVCTPAILSPNMVIFHTNETGQCCYMSQSTSFNKSHCFFEMKVLVVKTKMYQDICKPELYYMCENCESVTINIPLQNNTTYLWSETNPDKFTGSSSDLKWNKHVLLGWLALPSIEKSVPICNIAVLKKTTNVSILQCQ